MLDDIKRLMWQENERGLHLRLQVLGDTYSASGVSLETTLEVLVLELADALEEQMRLVEAAGLTTADGDGAAGDVSGSSQPAD